MAEPLSPAARAVMDAGLRHVFHRFSIAAALRAAADQVVPDVTPPIDDFDEHSIGFAAAHRKYRRELLAIAAELEGGDA